MMEQWNAGKHATALLWTALMLTAAAADPAGRIHTQPGSGGERGRLYTQPDPSAQGGIRGEIAHSASSIVQILAVPPDEPRFVYEGRVSGPARREFSFEGMPMRRYDLVVITEDSLYEGLTLHREENTLTAEDRAKIEATVQKAEPYFTKKIVHRVEGSTGRSSECRCICTYLRDTRSTNSPGGDKTYRRSFRLLILKNVGPGWQVVRSRDLYPAWTSLDRVTVKHRYVKALSGIRVTDRVKDVGSISLIGP